MRKRDQISLEDLLENITKDAGAWKNYAHDYPNRIDYNAKGEFRVARHNTLVMETTDAAKAVEAYNDLP